ncbi:MAG: DNA repair protein RecO [Thermodesulfobacteriota bacterium]
MLVAGFRAMEQNIPSRPVILMCLIIKFLWMCGYGPRVSACGRCGAAFSGDFAYFFPEYGSVLCQSCRITGAGRALRIGQETVRFFGEARSRTFTELLGYLPAEEVLREARKLIDGHGAHMCGGRCRPGLEIPAVAASTSEPWN